MPSDDSSSIRPVLRGAAQWLNNYARLALSTIAPSNIGPILFGICSAVRPLQVDEWPSDTSELIECLVVRLADELASPRGEACESSGFVSALMAAAALQSKSQPAAILREICTNRWRSIEESKIFARSPTLIWTGRWLVTSITGETSRFFSQTWWKSEISKQISQYAISIPSIQQIIADLAAMSAFGAVVPPLPGPEREYLERILPFLTFYHVKEQDLDIVNPLIRALRYIRLVDIPEYRDALDFVLGRYQKDGSFTMRNMAAHLHSLDPQARINVQSNIHLPLTVGSIWALLDCFFPGNLFSQTPVAGVVSV